MSCFRSVFIRHKFKMLFFQILHCCLAGHLVNGFKLSTEVKNLDGFESKQVIRERRTVPTAEAVLMYSTQDSIFELPFNSVSSAIKEADFRKVYDSNKYTVAAFSASYKEGDNLLMYGKNQIHARPLR